MDRETTHAAYQSPDVPAANVTFEWNEDSTVLTVDPNADLPYVEDNSPAAVARSFTATVTDTAEDRAGHPLAADVEWSFSTLRRISQMLPADALIFRNSAGPEPSLPCETGDGPDNVGSMILVSFDLRSLPDGVVAWESATLRGDQIGASHEGVIDSMGPFFLYHMSVFPPESVSWTTPPLRVLGPFTDAVDSGPRMVNVLVALTEDYERRKERNRLTQYRLSFERITNGNGVADRIDLVCGFALEVRYLFP
jgi:hypothetical protein